jgi:Fe-S cluster biosynthesis and repair protein YggX
MPKERVKVPELEKLVQTGRKKFVRYAEGAALYSLGIHTFQEVAKEANAVYRVKRCVLVNTEKVDAYMENFCDSEC